MLHRGHEFGFRGVRIADNDIGPQRIVEEVGVLGDERDAPAQIVQPVVAQVRAVHGDAAFVRIPEAHEKLRHGRLTGA